MIATLANKRRARGRAFTLLETVLAAVVGLMVLATCMSVLTVLRRTDDTLSGRAASTLQFEASQRFIRRGISSMLTSPTNTDGSATSSGRRFSLEIQPSGEMLTPQIWTDERAGPPQRLELVMSEPLLTGGRTGPAVLASNRTAPRTQDESLITRSELTGYRGVFELRTTPRDQPTALSAPVQTTHELWWVPARPLGLPEAQQFDQMTLPNPVMLADGLTFVRWRVFSGREWRDRYQASVTTDLPAYVELKLEALSGAHARWLFEIGWDEGEEYAPPLEDEADEDSTDQTEDGDLPFNEDELPGELQDELERARQQNPGLLGEDGSGIGGGQ